MIVTYPHLAPVHVQAALITDTEYAAKNPIQIDQTIAVIISPLRIGLIFDVINTHMVI